MKQWIADYLKAQKAAHDSIPVDSVEQIIEKFREALRNDYAYEDVFVRQLMNYGRPGDLVLVMSVSGNSPNVVKAVEWANKNGLHTIALVGGKRGKLAELAHQAIVINDTHYGRTEDAHMGICHMICYAFMENPGQDR